MSKHPTGLIYGLLAAELFGSSTPFVKMLPGHCGSVMLAGRRDQVASLGRRNCIVGWTRMGMCLAVGLMLISQGRAERPNREMPKGLDEVQIALDLREVPPAKAFELLERAIREADPGRSGVRFGFSPEVAQEFVELAQEKGGYTMTVNIAKISPKEAIKMVCELLNVNWRVEGDIVYVFPLMVE